MTLTRRPVFYLSGRPFLFQKLSTQNDEEETNQDLGAMGGIKDEEFAERYSSTVDTMSKKFLRKRERTDEETPARNKKFKKPRLND